MGGHSKSTVLGGRYSLTSRIAIGGMGQVWAAIDTVLGRQVAVKILRDDLVDSPVFLERFRAEARHSAALAHPGIANVYDYGEDLEDGRHVAYLVMELVPGRPLSKLMSEQGILPINLVLSLLAQTSEALHAAHVAGVVHRDVKPGNLLLTDDGTIKVTDFGIARAANSVALTEVGQVIGTARYISPEQAIGGEATAASDVYSLGVIGYEMLAGHPPFTAGNVGALAMAHVHQPPPDLPPTVPPALRAAISSALAKNPADRPADAQAFAATLRQLQLATMPPPGGVVDLGEATMVITDVDRDATQTRLMGADDGARTAIMPPGGIIEPLPDLGVAQEAYAARRQRRNLGIMALAVVIVVIGLLQLGGADSPTPLLGTTTTTPGQTPEATVAVGVSPSTIATTTTTTTVVPKQEGNGKGNGKPKG